MHAVGAWNVSATWHVSNPIVCMLSENQGCIYKIMGLSLHTVDFMRAKKESVCSKIFQQILSSATRLARGHVLARGCIQAWSHTLLLM